MKLFSFMRKPLKLLLYGVLLTLLCTVSLFFFLQYQTDKQTLDEWLNNYAYIGTVYPNMEGVALLTPLPEQTQTLLKEADTITSLHTMQTYAAKLTDGHIVADTMMTSNQLQQHFFLQAKVTEVRDWGASYDFKYDHYTIELIKEWGSNKVGTRSLHVNLLRLANEPAWEIGQEVFFISDYVLDDGFVIVVDFELYTPAAWEALTKTKPVDIFMEHPYLLLKEGEGEKEILNFMEETGIAPFYEKFTQLDGNLTVRAISNFTSLPKAATGRLYVTDGRAIMETDAGKKVCMVSQNLANRNRYCIGDTISLSISEESYSLNGWENGNPMLEDDLITSYAPAEEYEIIGIYHQIARNATDPLYYSHTDIFIPVKSEAATFPLPYAFSFRLLGVDYDKFMEETLPLLEETGCEVRLTDTGWQDVEDAFYSMELRCNLMFWCTVLAFITAAVVFSVLLFLHLRMDYGLQRLMGAYRKEACLVYFAAVTVIAVPALLLSCVISQLIVKELLLSAFLLPFTLLITICLLLLLFLTVSERGSLRKIIM